jgi:hypothetical protein
MRINTLHSRRAVATLAAFLAFSFLASAATAAAKRAPNIEGTWEGTLFAKGFKPDPYVLNITDQKKNGKFTGQANFVGFAPVNLTGKIQPNRKVKGSFGGDINGEPIIFTVKVKVSSDGQSAEGKFDGKDEGGNVVVTGTTTLDKAGS